jgi:hypothetical protein
MTAGLRTMLLALPLALASPALGQQLPPLPVTPTATYRNYSRDLVRYAFDARFWTWSQYPGLGARRESTSGLYLSQARSTRDASGAAWQTWSASFFNESAAKYLRENLFPPQTFRDRILQPKRAVRLPDDSVTVKVLFTENVRPGMHTIKANVAAAQGGSASKNGHLVPSLMAEKTLGLLQIDISTRQAEEWTWFTYAFQPLAPVLTQVRTTGLPGKVGNVALLRADGVYGSLTYAKRFRGPADNPASTCIACHQRVQYPPLNISQFTNDPKHLERHPGPWPIVWPGEQTARDGVRLDFMWEAAQALQQWDTDERLHLPHSLGPHPDPVLGGPKDGPDGRDGGLTGGIPDLDDFAPDVR